MSRHPQPPKRADRPTNRPAPPNRSGSEPPAVSQGQPTAAKQAPSKGGQPAASKAPAGAKQGSAQAQRPATAAKSSPKAAKPPPPGALDAIGLSKLYGERPAVAELDLHVDYGESVAIIGHNGSGKTTFLRMAAGLIEPSDGTVLVDGHPAGSLPARAAMSYLSDSPTFYEDLSVWEHLEYVARLHGHDDWEQDGADLLDHLGLYDRADDLPTSFSRGLRQKASIAMAFIRPFDVLLVDEPFVGLDAAGKEALLELLAEAHADQQTLVVATHELTFLEKVTRCVALRDGELIYDGSSSGVDVLSLVS
jgi:ABC-type multidrug transport system ATPase subunit